MADRDDDLARGLGRLFGTDLPGPGFDRGVLERIDAADAPGATFGLAPGRLAAVWPFALAASLMLAALLPVALRPSAEERGVGGPAGPGPDGASAPLDGEGPVDPKLADELEASLLFTEVAVDFRGADLATALAELSGATGVRFRVLPEVEEAKPLGERVLSYRAEGVSAKTALDVISAAEGLAWSIEGRRVRGGHVTIRRADPLPEGIVLRIHDLGDLVDDEDPPTSDRMPVETVLEAVQEAFDEAAWDAGAGFDYHEGGALILRAPERVQRRVAELIAGFRSRNR